MRRTSRHVVAIFASAIVGAGMATLVLRAPNLRGHGSLFLILAAQWWLITAVLYSRGGPRAGGREILTNLLLASSFTLLGVSNLYFSAPTWMSLLVLGAGAVFSFVAVWIRWRTSSRKHAEARAAIQARHDAVVRSWEERAAQAASAPDRE